MMIAAQHLRYGDITQYGEVATAEPRSSYPDTHTYVNFHDPRRARLQTLRAMQALGPNATAYADDSWVAVPHDYLFDVSMREAR